MLNKISQFTLDILAVQRVGASGIKNLAAMPLTTQSALPINLTQLNETLTKLNIHLKPFVLSLISLFENCTNHTGSPLKW